MPTPMLTTLVALPRPQPSFERIDTTALRVGTHRPRCFFVREHVASQQHFPLDGLQSEGVFEQLPTAHDLGDARFVMLTGERRKGALELLGQFPVLHSAGFEPTVLTVLAVPLV